MLRKHSGLTDQRKAALHRKSDAKRLLEAGERHTRGAAYLGGYAIECKIKAIAMEIYDCWTLDQLATKWRVSDRDVYTHGLEALLARLPFYDRFRASQTWRFFSVVNQWRPSWRYSPLPIGRERAGEFLQAVDRVYNWLEANR